MKEQLETTTTELAKASKELKLSQEALEGTGMQLAATKARLDGKTTELESTESELKLTQETLVATKARLDGKATELEGIKAELDFEQTARQRLEGELAVTREALVASNKKSAIGLMLAKLLFLFLALIVVSLGTSSQLPLAVVSRIDSAHMYPEEMSEAWMTMDEFGWFG